MTGKTRAIFYLWHSKKTKLPFPLRQKKTGIFLKKVLSPISSLLWTKIFFEENALSIAIPGLPPEKIV